MDRFDQRLEEHSLFTDVQSIATALDGLLDEVESSDALFELQRIRDASDYIKSVLSSVEPHLTSPTTLNGIRQHTSRVSTELNSYKSSKNLSHLQNANDQLDQALHTVRLLPMAADLETVEQIKDDVVSFRRAAGQLLRYLEKEIEASRGELTALAGEINVERDRIENQASRVDEAIAQSQRQFSEAEDRRRERFDTAVEERTEKFTALLAEAEGDLDALKREQEESAATLLENLQRLHDQAAELVGVIGNTGKAGQYQQIADQEMTSADRWRLVSVAAMSGIVLTALSLLIWPAADDWTSFGTRLFLSAGLGILATYTAKESSQHRRRERQSRKAALELAALNPYLALLSDDTQRDVKVRLADRFFGLPDEEGRQTDEFSALPLVEVLKKALDKIPDR